MTYESEELFIVAVYIIFYGCLRRAMFSFRQLWLDQRSWANTGLAGMLCFALPLLTLRRWPWSFTTVAHPLIDSCYLNIVTNDKLCCIRTAPVWICRLRTIYNTTAFTSQIGNKMVTFLSVFLLHFEGNNLSIEHHRVLNYSQSRSSAQVIFKSENSLHCTHGTKIGGSIKGDKPLCIGKKWSSDGQNWTWSFMQ